MRAVPIGMALIAGSLGAFTTADAERVRTLFVNDRSVEPVFLAMGRSSVLRFDDKPKTVIIGNQNYFSIAYVGSDISIQPLGRTSTNLFVYTEFQTYALILKVVDASHYDDIVYVKWKPAYVSVAPAGKQVTKTLAESRLNEQLVIPGLARFQLKRLIPLLGDISALDLSVENLGSDPIQEKDLEIHLSENGKQIATEAMGLRAGDAIAPHGREDLRVLAKVQDVRHLVFTASLHGKTAMCHLNRGERGHLRSKKR